MSEESDNRERVASALRDLGHEFMSRGLTNEDLRVAEGQVLDMLERFRRAPQRQRSVSVGSLDEFTMLLPSERQLRIHDIFADSVVSGGANPMGLGASLWRDGSTAVIEVSLGQAFEGAPGRAHGGIVAALIDETMGVAMAMEEVLAYTVKLDITFRAPTPLNEPILARAWVEDRSGRKLTLNAVLRVGDTMLAEATGLFISVDPATFLEHVLTID